MKNQLNSHIFHFITIIFLLTVIIHQSTVECSPAIRRLVRDVHTNLDQQTARNLTDCNRDGKAYSNGERWLVDPKTPCHVCVCQGGEITCNYLKCYIRDDCEPKYQPSVCCPEYEKCPPLEKVKLSSKEHYSDGPSELGNLPKISIESVKLTTKIPESTVNSIEPTTPSPMIDNPLGIKIKEITKPEEIRITNDDKPKVYKPVVKLPEPTSTVGIIFESSTISSSSEPNYQDVDDPIEPENEDGIQSSPQTIPDDDPLKERIELDSIGSIDEPEHDIDGDSVKNTREINNVTDFERFTTEDIEQSTARNTTHNPLRTEILQIGSQVFIVDSAGVTQSINILNADGLILGVDEEEKKVSSTISPEQSTIDVFDGSSTSSVRPAESTSQKYQIEDEYMEIPNDQAVDEINNRNTTEEHIVYNVQYYSSESPTSSEEVYPVVYYHPQDVTEGLTDDFNQTTEPGLESLRSTAEPEIGPVRSTTEEQEIGGETISTTIDPDEGPYEYPGFVNITGNDDWSIHAKEMEIYDKNHESSRHKSPSSKLITTEQQRTTIGLDVNESSHSPSSELSSESSEYNKDTRERSPGEPFLVPEWERNNLTTVEPTERSNKMSRDTSEQMNNNILNDDEIYKTSKEAIESSESMSSEEQSSSVSSNSNFGGTSTTEGYDYDPNTDSEDVDVTDDHSASQTNEIPLMEFGSKQKVTKDLTDMARDFLSFPANRWLFNRR